ncbi:hypothetical protein B0H19DRAFT_1083377 [Mycena capillaripes]|nr:hypothetical protein B0H19DRAFT_1083377 [Mycena capillaripes]
MPSIAVGCAQYDMKHQTGRDRGGGIRRDPPTKAAQRKRSIQRRGEPMGIGPLEVQAENTLRGASEGGGKRGHPQAKAACRTDCSHDIARRELEGSEKRGQEAAGSAARSGTQTGPDDPKKPETTGMDLTKARVSLDGAWCRWSAAGRGDGRAWIGGASRRQAVASGQARA